jgi:hypothetical protein
VDWTWNELVNRRLWRSFRLHTGGSISITALHERLDALLRLPCRARCIQRLIVGPITWQWDAELLQKMTYLWAAIPFLSELTFDVPRTNPDLSRGGEFAPVIRGLLLHGSHIRLHSFTYRHYMMPNSPLESFHCTTLDKNPFWHMFAMEDISGHYPSLSSCASGDQMRS